MYRYSFTRFIDFMLNNKRLADFTNLFSPNTIKKNNEIISEKITQNLFNDISQHKNQA